MADIANRTSDDVNLKYEIDRDNNTFKRVVKDDPADEISVEIGDSKQPSFKPQFKLMRWGNETNFSLRAQEHPEAVVRTEGDVVKYVTPDYEVHQYDKKIPEPRGTEPEELKKGVNYAVTFENGTLFVDGRKWGTSNENDIKAYKKYADISSGDVLMAGLKTGEFIDKALANENINSITVVEVSQDVIDTVLSEKPYLKDEPKLTIVNEYFYDYNGGKFDFVAGDLWIGYGNNKASKEVWENFKTHAQSLLKDGGTLYNGCLGDAVANYKPREEDGFEFEWVLNKKPTSNVLTSTIETKGLDFFYQPELTQEEKDRGNIRPENVVGSYAVYHKTKKHNIVGGKHYQTGKAFHIYRPKVIDSNGDWVWGELNIDGGALTVTVPQEFLDTAVYPVIVDPTFGYSTIGGTTDTTVARLGSEFTLGDNADVSKITAYDDYGGKADDEMERRCFIYNKDETTLNSYTNEVVSVQNASWKDYTFSSNPSISSDDWILALQVTGNVFGGGHRYDTGATNQGWESSQQYSDLGDATAGEITRHNQKVSIYATYTATVSDLSVNVSDSVSVSENVLASVGGPQASLSDSVSVAENVSLEVSSLSVNVNDSLSISESVLTGGVPNPAVSDTVTVDEHIIALGGFPDNPVATDGISVSENVSLTVSDLNINVSDSLSVSDAPDLLVTKFIHTSEAVSVSESIDVDYHLDIYGTEILDYYYNPDFDSWGALTSDDSKSGQSFVGNGDSIAKSKWYLKRDGSPTGNIVSKLYNATTDGEGLYIPSGSPVATSDEVDVTTISDLDFEFIDFNFSTPYETTDGNYYVVTIEGTASLSGDGSNRVFDARDNDGGHSGNASTWNSSESTWNSVAGGLDRLFYVMTVATKGVEDRLLITENSQVSIFNFNVDISDSISLLENIDVIVSAPVGLSISVEDTVGISEALELIAGEPDQPVTSDSISVSESVNVSVQAPVDFNISVSDDISLSEQVIGAVSSPTIEVLDNVSLSDIVSMGGVPNPTVTDTITVDEHIVALGGFPDNPIATDGISVGESVSVSVDAPQIEVSDTISLSESISSTTSDLSIGVSDSISIGENIDVYKDITPSPSTSDSVSVSEQVSVSVSTPQISVSETVSISEYLDILGGFPDDVLVSDSISITENVSVDLSSLFNINVSDSISISESTSQVITPLILNVNDTITIEELIDSITSSPQISTSESISLSENIDLLTVYNIYSSDSLSVSENVDTFIVLRRKGILDVDKPKVRFSVRKDKSKFGVKDRGSKSRVTHKEGKPKINIK